MTHIESNVITSATDSDIQHLETCERCRSRIAADVDLGSVRDQLLSVATTEPRSVTPHPKRSWNPWLVGIGAAALVAALFVPLLLLDSPTASESAATQPSIAPTTVVPALPPSLSEGEPEPPAPPPLSPGSFEMAFEGDGGVIGRLIWASPEFLEGLRITASGEPTFDYSFYRAADGQGFSDRTFNPFPMTEDGIPQVGALPEDPSVPWNILLERLNPESMWAAVGGDGQPVPATPTHPLADSAFADGVIRLEVSEQGIPVLVESPSLGSWQVTSLRHRQIRTGEIGNNIELPFNYAVHLAASTSEEQLSVIGDGMVTFDDYQAAAARTAECAGVEFGFDDSTGLFRLEPSSLLDDCRARYLTDIEEIWRIDSQHLDEDEFVILWYTAEGQPELAEMYIAEPGPELPLASGVGWAVSIWERGEGVCTRTSVGTSLSEWCNLPSLWQIPNTLDISVGQSYDTEGNLSGVELTGLVDEAVTSLVVVFASGESVELTPGETSHFGVRGFGHASFDAVRLGELVTVEVFAGDEIVGVYDHPDVAGPAR